jgi:hypothetical protein
VKRYADFSYPLGTITKKYKGFVLNMNKLNAKCLRFMEYRTDVKPDGASENRDICGMLSEEDSDGDNRWKWVQREPEPFRSQVTAQDHEYGAIKRLHLGIFN